jgi:hypothetical protein
VLEGERRRSGTGGDPELREDVLDVARRRVLADHERRRDLAIALAGRNEAEHLELARREPIPAISTAPEQLLNAGGVRQGAEPDEVGQRRLELERAGIGVVE